MNSVRLPRAIALLGLLLLAVPAVQAAPTATATTPAAPPPPAINANLKDAFYHLPIPGIDQAMDGLFNALQKGESGGYGATLTVDMPNVGKVPLQLYFFGKAEKQVLMLIVDSGVAIPEVYKNKTWKKLAGAKLTDPIFTVSTTDFLLKTGEMPAAYRKVVADSYYNVAALSFTSGFQVAARIQVAGAMKDGIEKTLGFPIHDFTMRAGLVIPVPADATAAAQLAAQIAADMKNLTKTIQDQPNFFVELQTAPGSKLTAPLHMSSLVATDVTISLDTELLLGFKGNILLPSGKKFITYFDTPLLVPATGLTELTSFDFGFASQTVTYKDISELALAMSTPAMNGGHLIKGLDKYRDQLRSFANALAVLELTNPNHIGDYVFGDPSKPFPQKTAFNLAVAGPTASMSDANGRQIDGPYFVAMGNLKVLGQKMGSGKLTIGESGLLGIASAGLKLNMGPLGKTGISMTSSADIDDKKQSLLVHGNVLGRSLDAKLDPTHLMVDSPATCATPFSLSTTVKITPTLDLSNIMDITPGVNVDPAKLAGCIGDDLKKAYQWVTTTGSSLGGYAVSDANAALKKINDDAMKAYNDAKNAARDVANKTSNTAMNAFRDADNAFRKLGFKKKKHHKGPDPKFAASVFDWDYYYDNAQDVVKAKTDLATHWRNNGFAERRQGSSTFDAKFYLGRYSDTKEKCGTDLQCALNHWLEEGIRTGRQGSAQFSVSAYMHRYFDLRHDYGRESYGDALQNWIDTGEDAGRDGSPYTTAPGPISGPRWAGSGDGSQWSDRDSVCVNQFGNGGADEFVTGFRFHTTQAVDGAQFQYAYSKWGEVHGSTLTPQVQVTLPQGEYFTRVEWLSTSSVNRLTLFTNKNRTFGPYGYNKGQFYSYQVTPGEKLGCMWGYQSSWLTQLVFSSTGAR